MAVSLSAKRCAFAWHLCIIALADRIAFRNPPCRRQLWHVSAEHANNQHAWQPAIGRHAAATAGATTS